MIFNNTNPNPNACIVPDKVRVTENYRLLIKIYMKSIIAAKPPQ